MNDWDKLYETALEIASRAHAGQRDRCGRPYIEHPLAVAAQLDDGPARVVALLHDVIEDCGVSPRQLRGAGMPKSVVDSVVLLTRDPNEPYLDYIERVKKDPVAAAVKLADLAHNSDPARLPEPLSPADRERLEKYEKAQKILRDTLDTV